MFSETKKLREETPGLNNRILPGTKVKGDIIADTDLRIDGELEGNLKSTAKVFIGKTGSINGKVECASADIEGKFNGTLNVQTLLSLKSTAVIDGEVTVEKLAVEPGATFNATCTMKGAEVKSLKNDTGKAEKSA